MAEWAAQAPAFGLVFARCGGLLALAPPLGTRQFPLALRLGLAAVLAAALAPVAELTPQVGAVTICEYSALLVREAAIGLATGFAAALVFHAFTVAGGLLDSFLGAGSATQRAEGIGPLATLSWTLAAAVFVAIDGHHLVIRALAEGLRVLPVGGPVAAGELAAMADAVRAMLAAGVQIAAPTLAAIYVAEVVLAACDRLAPAAGLAEAALPVRWTAALLGFAVSAPLFVALVSEHGARAVRALAQMTTLLGGG